jgi:hypothetical protein
VLAEDLREVPEVRVIDEPRVDLAAVATFDFLFAASCSFSMRSAERPDFSSQSSPNSSPSVSSMRSRSTFSAVVIASRGSGGMPP